MSAELLASGMYGLLLRVRAQNAARDMDEDLLDGINRAIADHEAATPPQAPQADKGPTDTEMLDWLETAYTSGGFKPKPWRDFMTQVAHLGYRAAISAAMKDHQP